MTSDSGANVSDGVVIEDSLGNQFVWIPVNRESDYVQDLSYPTCQTQKIVTAWDEQWPYPDGIYRIESSCRISEVFMCRGMR